MSRQELFKFFEIIEEENYHVPKLKLKVYISKVYRYTEYPLLAFMFS